MLAAARVQAAGRAPTCVPGSGNRRGLRHCPTCKGPLRSISSNLRPLVPGRIYNGLSF